MFSSGANYSKLKTNLRLIISRLKLLQKKKTEQAMKARKEIADYISAGKDDRARIRVEHIIREDYYVEAMELLEMYSDLLLARFGLIQTQKELDPGLEEAIASLIWASPRLQAEVQEFKHVTDQLSHKYGKEFTTACRSNQLNNVNEKVMHKLGVQAPPKLLVENYMVEIAKSYNIPFVPDKSVMEQDEVYTAENLLIDLGIDKKGGPGSGSSGGGGGGGGTCVPQAMAGGASAPPVNQQAYPPPEYSPSQPMVYPPPQNSGPPPPPVQAAMGPGPFVDPAAASKPSSYDQWLGPDPKKEQQNQPPPQAGPPPSAGFVLPDLPSVPANSLPQHSVGDSSVGGEDVDFDDLTKRFEQLKKKK